VEVCLNIERSKGEPKADIQFFLPETFSRDYQIVAEALSHTHYAIVSHCHQLTTLGQKLMV
jgi:hypothetical protein